MKLTPREPTPNMVTAAAIAPGPVSYEGIWRAMHDAAPSAEPVADEPVAWRTFDGEGGYEYRTFESNENYAEEWKRRNPNHSGWVEPLYTHPAAAPVLKDCGEPAPGYCKHCKKYTIAEPLPAERGEYPPLPAHMDGESIYSAAEMRAYVDSDRAQMVPLTEAEIMALSNDCYDGGHTNPLILFARAIERAHGIGAKP